VDATQERPHGLSYSFTLHARDGTRLVGFDNAHGVPVPGSRFKERPSAIDHWHRTETDPGRPSHSRRTDMLKDFFDEAQRVLAEQFNEQMAAERRKHSQAQRQARETLGSKLAEREKQLEDLAAQFEALRQKGEEGRQRQESVIKSVVGRVNTNIRWFGRAATALLVLIALLDIFNLVTNYYEGTRIGYGLLLLLGFLGLYRMVCAYLDWLFYGVTAIKRWLGRALLQREIKRQGLQWLSVDGFEDKGGRIEARLRAPPVL
jgi:hypothetical protein